MIYSHLKMFRFPDRLEALASLKAAAPVHVRIKPTNVCNHSCWFCAYRADDLQLGQNMRVRDYLPREKMLEIIDDLAEMGVRAVTLSGGGEPLVYPFIAEMLERLSASGIRIGMLSNGSLLRGKLAEQVRAQATWIRVSMDGSDDKSYALSRRVREGEFSAILENMRAFQKLKGPCFLSVSYIVDKDNAGHLFETCAKLKDVGIRQLKLSPVIVANDGASQNAYHDPFAEQVSRMIDDVQNRLVDRDFSIANHYHRQNASFQKSYRRCGFARLLTVIGADQKVYLCQDKAYTDGGHIASLQGQSFREAWYSKEVQDRLQSVDPSRDCNHHCVAHQKNLLLEDYLESDPEHVDFV